MTITNCKRTVNRNYLTKLIKLNFMTKKRKLNRFFIALVFVALSAEMAKAKDSGTCGDNLTWALT